MAMRVALGADRRRIVRQLLIETLVLAVPGGVLGVALATVGTWALVAAAPANVPRLGEIHVNGTVLLFALAATFVTTVIFGLGPAVQAARTASDSLGQAGPRVAGARGVRRWHHALVVTELALAQMLLVGAALLLVSFSRATHVDLGFAVEGRVAAELNLAPEYVRPLGEDGRIDPGKKIRFIDHVVERMSRERGVRAVAAAFTAPLTGAPNRGVRIEGDPEPKPEDQPSGAFQIITRDFFRAAGIPMVAGRAFTENDRANAPPVVIVNRAFVDQYFPGRDPIGHVLRFGGDRRHEIVGVVADARYRAVEEPADPTFYLPLEQNDERWPFLSFIVWSDGAAIPALRTAIRDADPQQPISRIRSVDEILSQSMAGRRFNTWLVGLFAGAAVLLAAIGTYGVMALAVSTRTRELGVRAALGAGPGTLVRLVLGQGLALSLVATALGLGAALAVTRFMASMLFGVTPGDPWTFGGVAVLLTTVAAAATVIPARRAMRISPTIALRDG